MRKNKSKKKGKQERSNNDVGPRKSYEDIVRENKDFETYYKLQKICPENKWDTFLQALRSDLPTSFRITSFRSEAKALLKIVQGQYFKDIINCCQEKHDTQKPVSLPWYPDNLAWQIQLTRKDIRSSEAFFKLHNFLISETESGGISRQEVVSMIPPIALGVESHHKILDMCASPGSKTAQLIEYLHKDVERMPEGFVIANDIDNNRCYMLVHQAKRLNSPNIVITNHDASIMPNFVVKNSDGKEEFLKFDRVLCDVPCTGDGTLRKNADIWTKWNTASGNNLHGVQFRIIKRGVEMLAVGGRLVYSTCSLNPLENEAVISRLLLESKDSLRLVDIASKLPGLQYTEGLTTWLVTSKDLRAYKSFDEVPEQWHTVVRPQMFPPSPEVATRLNLNRCIRILPHQQDTGAFFVAVLEKTGLLPWENPKGSEAVKVETSKSEIREPARKKRKIFGYREDPFIFFEEDEPVWKEIKAYGVVIAHAGLLMIYPNYSIRVTNKALERIMLFNRSPIVPYFYSQTEYYGISEEFPAQCLLTRCKEGKKKNIYLTSPQVRDIVMNNAAHIKIINTGVKVFSRCVTKGMTCPFRLVQEGLWIIHSFIGLKRKVSLRKEDFIVLLSMYNPNQPPETANLHPESQKKIAALGPGSCVLIYEDEDAADESSLQLNMVGWIGAVSTKAYIPLSDCIHYLRLLGGDTSKFDINKFKKPEGENDSSEKNGSVTEESIEENIIARDST